MRILLKSCTIVAKNGNFEGKQDLLIENGIIEKIQPSINEPADHVIEREKFTHFGRLV